MSLEVRKALASLIEWKRTRYYETPFCASERAYGCCVFVRELVVGLGDL